MSREIKFRAWDITKKEMVSVFRTDSHPDLSAPHSIIAGIAEDGHMLSRPLLNLEGHKPEFILMQYTGLKDKSGVEIYEDDIFKAPHDFGPGGFVEKIGVVEFHTEHGHGWNYWKLDELEIIGNRHQDPKLLEGK